MSLNTLKVVSLGLLLLFVSCSPPLPEDDGIQQLVTQADVSDLSGRIDAVLAAELKGRRLSSETNAAWQIMHGVICYGHELPLDTPDRGVVSALDYAFHEGVIRGWHLMPGQTLPNNRRGVKALLEPGSYIGQGHVDQWIAICAMANLPATDTLVIDDQTFTLLDWASKRGWMPARTR